MKNLQKELNNLGLEYEVKTVNKIAINILNHTYIVKALREIYVKSLLTDILYMNACNRSQRVSSMYIINKIN